jgi:hypothetical protein
MKPWRCTGIAKAATDHSSTTSVDNSGLLAAILPTFTKEAAITVHVLAQGTGQALATAARDASHGRLMLTVLGGLAEFKHLMVPVGLFNVSRTSRSPGRTRTQDAFARFRKTISRARSTKTRKLAAMWRRPG